MQKLVATLIPSRHLAAAGDNFDFVGGRPWSLTAPRHGRGLPGGGCSVPVELKPRRALVAARPTEAAQLGALFTDEALQSWEPLEADSLERARVLLHHNPYDILIVDESLYHHSGPSGLAWLAQQREVPTVLLAGMDPDAVTLAYEQGVSLCLPRNMTLENPSVLAAALRRALQIRERERSDRRTKEGLIQCRRHVERLVSLLWRTLPADPQHQWFTHRHILQRLQEEVSRSGRHGTVFTVALAEVQMPAGEAPEEQADIWHEWMTETLALAKRRCDVAGHYGANGFMLLMVNTPKPGGVAGCKRLQQYLRDVPQPTPGPHGPIRTCFGLSTFAEDMATSQSLLSRAEKHLEAAKAGAGEGVVAD
jgi:DNA-binding response OmpR family regulator